MQMKRIVLSRVDNLIFITIRPNHATKKKQKIYVRMYCITALSVRTFLSIAGVRVEKPETEEAKFPSNTREQK